MCVKISRMGMATFVGMTSGFSRTLPTTVPTGRPPTSAFTYTTSCPAAMRPIPKLLRTVLFEYKMKARAAFFAAAVCSEVGLSDDFHSSGHVAEMQQLHCLQHIHPSLRPLVAVRLSVCLSLFFSLCTSLISFQHFHHSVAAHWRSVY